MSKYKWQKDGIKQTGTVKFLSVFLSMAILLSMIPISGLLTAAAAVIETYTVTVTDNTAEKNPVQGAEITLTEKTDGTGESTFHTAVTNEEGKAFFESFVEEGKTYILHVAPIVGYADYKDEEVVVDVGNTEKSIQLTALEKVSITGTLKDENGDPYKGATATLSGYSEDEATTDENGQYTLTGYKGQEYTLTITGEEQYVPVTKQITALDETTGTIEDVVFTVKTFTITPSVIGANGKISLAPEADDEGKYQYGNSVVATVTADKNYRIASVKVDGKAVVEAVGQPSYEVPFNSIKADHTIDASFVRKTYTITLKYEGKGTVTGNPAREEGGNLVFDEEVNGSVTVTAEANKNYHITSFKVKAKGETEFKERVETSPESNKPISHNEDLAANDNYIVQVEFSIDTFAVNVQANEGGIVSTTAERVEYNESSIISIVPEKDCYLSAITVNGSDVSQCVVEDDNGKLTLTLNNISQNQNVHVTFAKSKEVEVMDLITNQYYTITFTKDGKQIVPVVKNAQYILPEGAQAEITPAKGYDRVRINGSQQGKEIVTIQEDIKLSLIEVRVGKAGKWENRVKPNIEILFDNTEPTISDVTKKPSEDWTNQTICVSGLVADDRSGVDKVYYAVSGAAEGQEANYDAEKGTFTFTVPNTAEFSGKYDVWAVDKWGNTSERTSVSIGIDTTAPKITGFTFTEKENEVALGDINITKYGIFSSKDIYVIVSAEDTGDHTRSGVKSITLYADGTAVATQETQNNQAQFAVTSQTFAGAELTATVTDIAGNTSAAPVGPKDLTPEQYGSSVVTISNSEPVLHITADQAVYQNEDGENWYAGDVNFTIDMTDDNSLRQVEVTINDQPITQDAQGNDISSRMDQGEIGITEKTFSINTQQIQGLEGKVTLKVSILNVANVKTTQESVVYIDRTPAAFTGFTVELTNQSPVEKAVNFLSFGLFCNAEVKVTVSANDPDPASGAKEITLYGGEDVLETQAVVDNQAVFTLPEDAVEDEALYFENGLKVMVEDNVGNIFAALPTQINEEIQSNDLMIETVPPTIDVTCADPAEGNPATVDGNDWYQNDVEFTVQTDDENAGLYQVQVSINNTVLVNDDLHSGDSAIMEKTYQVNTKDAQRNEDGSYVLKVVVTDNAGNQSSYSKTIYKDTDTPRITGFDFEAENYVEGSENQANVESTQYGFYFREDTRVIISTADDDGPSAGVKKITYYTVDKDQGKSQEITVNVDKDGKISFVIPANFKGQIYALPEDNVANKANTYVTPDGAILETSDKHEKETHITFDKAEAPYTDSNGGELYSSTVPVTITVTDTYSGIRDIQWSVIAPYNTTNNQSGTVTIGNDGKTVSGDAGWNVSKTESNLVTEMVKTIQVRNDSNNIVVLVKMTDRSGNTSEKKIEFGIDTTVPQIQVTYDNNSADPENTDYYKENRVATVVITERNFRAADVVMKITNTDGTLPGADLTRESAWTRSVNTQDPNLTTYTATIVYNADGDYTFDISYKDRANNTAAPFATHEFTIDKTLPVISVQYDNNSSSNGKYFKDTRTATVTVTEHNFDVNRVEFTQTAALDGTTFTAPAPQWSSNGDVHTATIVYDQDGDYTFDVTMHDMAGNASEAASYGGSAAAKEFTVDTTWEEIAKVEGVENESVLGLEDGSINVDTQITVTLSDINFESYELSLVRNRVLMDDNNPANPIVENDVDVTQQFISDWEGTGEKSVTFTIPKTSEKNGEQLSNDGIYTLRIEAEDMAGNVYDTEKNAVMFYVNRFGSVYALDQEFLDSISGKYIQQEQDIVLTEINVNSLENDSIALKVTQNGTPSDLTENEDYTTEKTGGNDQWSRYVYTIGKSLFAEDGRYSVSVYSRDGAGNVNENIDETKKAEVSFGVDKTKPVIVPADLEDDQQYAEQEKTASIEVKDNLVLESVSIDLNGTPVSFETDSDTYTFAIPESNEKQSVRIVAMDAAGNTQEILIENFLVSSNPLVRWYNNTPLFIGSLAGTVVVIGAIILLVFLGKKKKVKAQENNA